MESSEVSYIEQVVEKGYLARNEADRAELISLSERMSSSESLSQLLFLVSNSSHVLTVHFASGLMRKVFTDSVNSISVNDRREIRQMLIPVMTARCDWFCSFPPRGTPHTFALNTFCQLLARIWRICWFEISDNVDIDSDSSSDEDDDFSSIWGGKSSSSQPKKSSSNSEVMSDMASFVGDDPLLHVAAKKMILENPSIPSTLMGICVLSYLVEEMGLSLPNLWPSVQRKTAVAFRDRCLLDIFKISISTMQKLLVSNLPMTEPAKSQHKALVVATLDLILKIFGFDFVGTQPDDSSDEVGILHIPSNWGTIIENPDTLATFISFYHHVVSLKQGGESTKALEILSCFASVRSSVFGPSANQAKFLSSFFNELGKIIASRTGIYENRDSSQQQHQVSGFGSSNSGFGGNNNNNGFGGNNNGFGSNNSGFGSSGFPFATALTNSVTLCRLLVRLKCNFQLSQFIAVPHWKMFLEELMRFHSDLMESESCTPSLLYYIMSWWNRLCSALAYLSAGSEPTYLSDVVPVIINTFLRSQIKREVDFPDEEDGLLDDKQLAPILATLPGLLECHGRNELLTGLIAMFQEYGSQFASFNNYNPQDPPENLRIVERQLALLTHFVAVVANDRTSPLPSYGPSTLYGALGIKDSPPLSNDFDTLSAQEQAQLSIQEQAEILDAELVSCIFNVLQIHDERMNNFGHSGGSKYLEYALICFLRRFSSSYFSNDEIESTRLHKMLMERHGLETRDTVLEALLSKIAMNLKLWPSGTDISNETLQLFLSLVNGRISSRLVSKSALVNHLLGHHNELDLGPNARNRREFYRVLGRVAFKDSEIDELYTFLAPFDQKFMNLRDRLAVRPNDSSRGYSSDPTLANDVFVTFVDLRGTLMSCSSSSGYETFFDWFYPSGYYESVCLASLHRFAHVDWKTVWCVIKFVEELVSTSHKRIQFPNASSDGHRLFRDTANLLIDFAAKIMELPSSSNASGNGTNSGTIETEMNLNLNMNPGMGSSNSSSDSYNMLRSAALISNPASNKQDVDTRFKAILLFLRAFSRLLSGASDFANMGVFSLYGDKIVSQLFSSAFEVIFSMDIEEAQAYPKVIDVLYIALENVCMHNMTDLLSTDLNAASDALGKVLLLLKRGLRSKVVRIICCCTQSLDKIATHQYNILNRRRRPDAPPNIINDHHLAILSSIMFDLLDLILVDRDMIHWTLCRPLFILIQLLPESFQRIKEAIIKSQAGVEGRAEKIEEEFVNLYEGLDTSMRSENREKFTNNALNFKNACKLILDLNALYKEIHATFGSDL